MFDIRLRHIPVSGLAVIVSFFTALAAPANAGEAPVKFPNNWNVTEEPDSKGNQSWTATPSDDGKGISNILITRLPLDSEAQGSEDNLRTALKSFVDEFMEYNKEFKLKCEAYKKYTINKSTAIMNKCTTTESDITLNIEFLTIAKSNNIYVMRYLSGDYFYKKHLPVWKETYSSLSAQ